MPTIAQLKQQVDRIWVASFHSDLAEKLPKARQQRCVVHKIRNLERAFCYRELPLIDPVTQEPLSYQAARRLRRQQVCSDAHAIFEAASRAEAQERLAQFRTKWATLEVGGAAPPDKPTRTL